MIIGYSATLWDNAHSGIGRYIAEHLRILAGRKDVELRAIEFGGRVLAPGELPRAGSSAAGTGKTLDPIADIWWHRHSLKTVAQAQNFDLVHVPTIRRLPGKLPCPATVTVHDLGPIRLKGKYGFLRQLFHAHWIPRWLGSVASIITPSRFTLEDLVRFHGVDPAKITVVPNGVDHSFFCPGKPEASSELLRSQYGLDAPFFVYVSRLEHPAKNHVRLLCAFRIFKEKTRLPHKLVLVGSPWNGHEVIEDAAKPLSDVILAGYVPPEQLPHFLRASCAMIYPSLFEGFGLPVIEAMACGAPVACSRSSSLAEIAEGYGLLFDPENPAEMALCLEKLATDEDLRSKLRSLGLAHSGSFTWERSVDETIAVWKKTIEKK
jgi:glycosyltransferase involved in cell wall biosynthesis